MSENNINNLLPALIDKNDKAYVAVEELGRVLKETLARDKDEVSTGRRIKNVAITGPYGSGKSSIIQTLEHDFPQFKYLNISLATLRADSHLNDSQESEDVSNNFDNDNNRANGDETLDALNRRIEYSILQQIIYKEKSSKVPNSRLRRIRHFSNAELAQYGIGIIVFLLCFFIVFEPSWLRVDTFYEHFNFGTGNFWIDLACSIIMLVEIFLLIQRMVQAYSNSKLNKLNLKDGEIELQEASIFNKHLDEILYFFQVTKYNVVVIEDVDRFGTSEIFLKLRELNQLINESNVIDRPVVFMYAVKDDIFIDEDRVKFFDYIVTVVPTINPSNSKDKLKELLEQKGYSDFDDDDLSEIGFFIQDMRLLINIVNEYDQYHQRLIKENANLDNTKLLGMIVYKNFFPRDFAKLHRREGLVFEFLELKNKFIESAQSDVVRREKELEDLFESSKRDTHLQISELRALFITNLCNHLQGDIIRTIDINNHSYTPSDIAENEELFNSILKKKSLYYYYTYSYGSNNRSQNIDVQNFYVSSGFERRIKALELNQNQEKYDGIKRNLLSEKLSISSMRIKDFFDKYDVSAIPEYNNIKLPALIEIFLRRGYIDEDYYDYISYFYEGMISHSDRAVLVDIKRQRGGEYTKHIDHIENFTKELKPWNFTSDAILYVELLDYLVEPTPGATHKYLPLFYKRINRKPAPLKFLATYYAKGHHSKEVFTQFIASNPQSSWQQTLKHSDEAERGTLLCSWLRFVEYPVNGDVLKWINSNFNFISKFQEELTNDIIIKICEYAQFELIEINSNKLIGIVVESNAYALTAHNISVVIVYLGNGELDGANITLTKIWATNHDGFINYIQTNFKNVFPLFSKTEKSETVEALTYIINHSELEETEIGDYISGQTNILPSLKDINQDRWSLTLQKHVVNPNWITLQDYYNYVGKFDDALFEYIDKFANELSVLPFGSNGNAESIFFREIFLNSAISLETIKVLTPIFEGYSFNGDEELVNLDTERLEWFLSHDMILFEEGNSAVIKNTTIFAQYLVRYKDEFIETISEEFLNNPSTVMTLLDSDKFNTDERTIIINNIPESLAFNNSSIANRIISHISTLGKLDNSPSYYISLINIASSNIRAIELGIRLISDMDNGVSVCNNVLVALGEKYSELLDMNRNPKFEDTETHRKLFDSLINRGILSSYSPCKDNQIRTYHKKIK